MDTKKITMGVLTFILLSTSFYVYGPGVRIRVDDDKAVLYTSPADTLRWIKVATQYDKMRDGTSGMNRRLSDVTREIFFDYSSNLTKIVRTTPYIRGPVIVHTWYFDGNKKRKDNIPISEIVEIYNGTGYIYRYRVEDLYYSGETINAVELSEQQGNPYKIFFDKDTKIEWDDKSYWSKVYKTGSVFEARYKLESDYEIYAIRLLDPTEITACDSTDFTSADSYYMNGDVSGSEASDCIKFDGIATRWTLDCNDNKLTNTGTGRAIVLDGPDWGEIYDCTFEARDEVIYTLQGSDDNYFHDITVGFESDNPAGGSDLISLTGTAGDNNFTDITLDLAGCGGNADGIQDSDARTTFRRIKVLTTGVTDVANAIKVGIGGKIYDTYITNPVNDTCIQLGTNAIASNVSVSHNCGVNGVKLGSGAKLYNSTIFNITTHISGTNARVYWNNFTIEKSVFAFNTSGSGHIIYNNVINVTSNQLIISGDSNGASFNISKIDGIRIIGNGRRIGGNVWYNSTINYYDSCIDVNSDGYCDNPFIGNETLGVNGTDYLALSNEYLFDNVTILLPINNSIHYDSSVSLNWFSNGDPYWCGYSLNETSNITITNNITLSQLFPTFYNLTIVCNDSTSTVQSSYTYFNTSLFGTDNFTLLLSYLIES